MEPACLRLFNEYFQDHHGNLKEDCQEEIQAIFNAYDASRHIDQNNQVAQVQTNEAR